MHTIVVSGARPKQLYGYGPESDVRYDRLRDAIQVAIARAKAAYDDVRVVSGGAQGSEQLAVSAALATPGVTAEVWEPYQGQDANWLDEGRFGRESYRDMLSRADVVRDCAKDAPATERRADLYRARAALLAEAADELVLVEPASFDAKRSQSDAARVLALVADAGKPVTYVRA